MAAWRRSQSDTFRMLRVCGLEVRAFLISGCQTAGACSSRFKQLKMTEIATRGSLLSPGQHPPNPNALAMIIRHIQVKVQSRGATSRKGAIGSILAGSPGVQPWLQNSLWLPRRPVLQSKGGRRGMSDLRQRVFLQSLLFGCLLSALTLSIAHTFFGPRYTGEGEDAEATPCWQSDANSEPTLAVGVPETNLSSLDAEEQLRNLLSLLRCKDMDECIRHARTAGLPLSKRVSVWKLPYAKPEHRHSPSGWLARCATHTSGTSRFRDVSLCRSLLAPVARRSAAVSWEPRWVGVYYDTFGQQGHADDSMSDPELSGPLCDPLPQQSQGAVTPHWTWCAQEHMYWWRLYPC